LLDNFIQFDDSDIAVSTKMWANHDDVVLSQLCQKMINRKLFKIEIQDKPFDEDKVDRLKKNMKQKYKLNDEEAGYFVFSDHIINKAYSAFDDKIQILFKNNEIKDITEASDMFNLSVLSKIVKKYFICYPKENSI
jgi:hypothetical protein